uniref:DUF5689 domain-containing protein n=1 Tax=Alistipes megaguti TaxID=2364787 RepID=UPI001E407598|nr:DUF5689 domain-containing protein [Alistipes megaguti]
MKSLKIAIAVLVGALAAGCYNDFDTPAPRKIYTDSDMETLGLEQVSIKEVKGWFESAFGSISGTGTNDNWKTTNTLKFGDLAPEETKFEGMKGWPDASNKYIKGKVISSDRQGNIYKSLFIDDGTAGIELKLYNGLYLDYYLNLNTMESQWVYVRLDGLFLGNYRMMLSIGDAPSDSNNAAGKHKYYANSNLDNPNIAKQYVLPGERTTLDSSNITEVDPQTYTSLSKDHFGRLVRFKDVKVRYAGVPNQDHVVKDAMKNGGNTNIYPSWIVTDTGIPQNAPWYYMAYNIENIRLYGSLLISYNDAAEYTSDPGIYSVRTSGYSQFAMRPVPKDGAVGTVLGIYAIYSKQSTFTGGENDWAQYQISISRIEDLDFNEEDLLTETEADALARWAYDNGYSSYDPFDPPVKNDPMGGMEGGE